MSEPALVVLGHSDPAAFESLQQALASAGYRVEIDADGRALLAALSGASPDLVLLDESLRGARPLEILEALRKRPPVHEVPVVVTGCATAPVHAAAEVLTAGAVDFFRTPFDVAEALARIARHIERGRAVREARREAMTRGVVLDVLREVMASLSQEEIFNILVRRLAGVFEVRRASMVLLDEAREFGTVVAAHEDPSVRGLRIDLKRYPEICQAVASGSPLLVRDFRSSPFFDPLKSLWESEGIRIDLRSVAVVPFEYSGGEAGVFVLRTGSAETPLSEETLQVAGAVLQGAVRALERAEAFESIVSQRELLEVLARTDELTGCLSRRYLMERLANELERARRYERLLGIVMLDIDDFKQLNDTHGHTVGDEALRLVGWTLRRSLRASDVVGRYGGDEFLVVLPETGQEGTRLLAERIREDVSREPRSLRDATVRLTVSGGVAGFPDAGVAAVEQLVEQADEALYRAKSQGRNRIAE